jgi:hypothetical protein
LLASLPPAFRVRDLGDLEAFWRGFASEMAPEAAAKGSPDVRHLT